MPVVTRAQYKRQQEQQKKEVEGFLKKLEKDCIEIAGLKSFNLDKKPVIHIFSSNILNDTNYMNHLEVVFSHNVKTLVDHVERSMDKKMRLIGVLALFQTLNHILPSLLIYAPNKYKIFTQTLRTKCIQLESEKMNGMLNDLKDDALIENCIKTIQVTKKYIDDVLGN